MKQLRVIAVLLTGLVLQAPALTATPQQRGYAADVAPAAVSVAAVPAEAVLPTHGNGVDAASLEDLDDIVRAAMSEWSVPGLALAIVGDGSIILSRGYGYRHAESRLPVTPNTLFPIASVTKPFTALLLAELVAEGALEWDRPVVDYLPDFRLRDEQRTRAVTPRDLVTHQSGLPRHDFVWYGSDLSTRDLYERLRFLEPSKPLRAEWQYQNLMFMTAGYLAAEVTGSSWEQLVRERLFAPLGMEHSTFSLRQLKQRADIAFPYAEGSGGARRVPFRGMDAVGPAGSINASAEELARFVSMLVNGGSYDGLRPVDETVVTQLLEPQVELPADAVDPALGDSAYGLGLVLSEYAGHRVAHHAGAVDGFVSLMSFLPDDGIGVVVLTNFSGDNPVPWIVTRSVYDRLLGRAPRDWIRYARETVTLRQPEERKVRVTASPIGSWRQGLDRPMPADYAGSYWHPAYGQLDVVLSGNDLAMRFHGIDAALEPIGNDCYRVMEGSLSGLRLSFFTNAMRRIDRVAIPWEPEVSDIVFVRRSTADGHDDGMP